MRALYVPFKGVYWALIPSFHTKNQPVLGLLGQALKETAARHILWFVLCESVGEDGGGGGWLGFSVLGLGFEVWGLGSRV